MKMVILLLAGSFCCFHQLIADTESTSCQSVEQAVVDELRGEYFEAKRVPTTDSREEIDRALFEMAHANSNEAYDFLTTSNPLEINERPLL